MRKPKYRLWNKNLKTMVSYKEMEKGLRDISKIDNTKGIFIPSNEDTIIMQYTGRVDDFGVDVYEGDIVGVNDTYTGREFIGVVFFRDCSFIIKNSTSSNYRWMDYEIKVLGNMYDNEELMEDLAIMEKIKEREKNDNGIRYSLDEIREIFNLK